MRNNKIKREYIITNLKKTKKERGNKIEKTEIEGRRKKGKKQFEQKESNRLGRSLVKKYNVANIGPPEHPNIVNKRKANTGLISLSTTNMMSTDNKVSIPSDKGKGRNPI